MVSLFELSKNRYPGNFKLVDKLYLNLFIKAALAQRKLLDVRYDD